MKWSEHCEMDGHDVDVRVLTEEDFDGDTLITLPGVGQVNVTRNGEEIEVEVETDQVESLRAGGRAVIVTKEVTVDSH